MPHQQATSGLHWLIISYVSVGYLTAMYNSLSVWLEMTGRE